MKITKHLIVHGRVQGVNFREAMRMEAQRLGVTGWVRNRHDGTVEAVLHGWPDDVNAMLDWTRRGPPGARVVQMDVNEAAGEYPASTSYSSGARATSEAPTKSRIVRCVRGGWLQSRAVCLCPGREPACF
jgi:acylphosphatase